MERPSPQPSGKENARPPSGTRFGKIWFWIFLLSGIWVFCFQLDATSLFLVFSDLAEAYEIVGISFYPVFILGFAVIPFLLDRAGFGTDAVQCRRLMFALPAVTLALLLGLVSLLLLMDAVPKPLCLLLYYGILLLPCIVMGMALRRGVEVWEPRKTALYIGIWHIAFYIVHDLGYFYFIYGQNLWNPTVVLLTTIGLYAAQYIGLLIALMVLRAPLGSDDEKPDPVPVLPERFIRSTLLCIAVFMLILSFLNTVYYFEDMEEFHTPLYEMLFNLTALGVMGAATLLLYRGKWLVLSVCCVLLICLGQGLSLFSTAPQPLRTLYNYITMAGKTPLLLCGLYIPVHLAAKRRSAGWLAPAGFVLLQTTTFLPGFLNLLGVTFRDKPMPGLLLAASLLAAGVLVWLIVRYERVEAQDLLAGLKAEQKPPKSCEELLQEWNLTPRERSIAALLLQGDSMKMVAAKLSISQATVNTHMTNLYRKLHIQSRSELFALFMVREGHDGTA